MGSGALDVVWPCFLNEDGKQKPIYIYKYGVPNCNLGPTLILYILFLIIYNKIYLQYIHYRS